MRDRGFAFLLVMSFGPRLALAGDSFALENLLDHQDLAPIQLNVPSAGECRAKILELCGGRDLRSCGVVTVAENPARNTALSPTQRSSAYGEWRFRLALQHYQRTAVQPQPEFFCGLYEREGRRDKAFALARVNEFMPVSAFEAGTAQTLAEKYGLTEAELAAMSGYWGSFYKEINPALRSGSLPHKFRIFVDVFNSALAKLPASSAKPLMRNTNLPADALGEHTEGNVVTYAAYTSTKNDCNSYSFGIHSFAIFATPASSRDFNVYSGTGEVILPPGTRLKVIARRELGEGRVHFVLAEVDATGALLVQLPDPLPLKPTVCN